MDIETVKARLIAQFNQTNAPIHILMEVDMSGSFFGLTKDRSGIRFAEERKFFLPEHNIVLLVETIDDKEGIFQTRFVESFRFGNEDFFRIVSSRHSIVSIKEFIEVEGNSVVFSFSRSWVTSSEFNYTQNKSYSYHDNPCRCVFDVVNQVMTYEGISSGQEFADIMLMKNKPHDETFVSFQKKSNTIDLLNAISDLMDTMDMSLIREVAIIEAFKVRSSGSNATTSLGIISALENISFVSAD